LFYYVLILFIVGEFVLFHFWIIDHCWHYRNRLHLCAVFILKFLFQSFFAPSLAAASFDVLPRLQLTTFGMLLIDR